jgi:hypothetical protein
MGGEAIAQRRAREVALEAVAVSWILGVEEGC